MTSEHDKQLIRKARGNFVAMAATYCLGVFNDSFFRQSAMLLAVAAGEKTAQGQVMAVFTLPYLLFAAPVGWLADRFPKSHIVIGAKVLELVAMICGGIGICTGNWTFIMVMVFMMGLQSAIFSPSLNGSIPELYPASYVPRANALLKVVVTAAILGGVSLSGIALDMETPSLGGVSRGRLIVGFGVIIISGLGVLFSLGVPRRKAASPHAKFPWRGPLDTISDLRKIWADSLLGTVVLGNTFAWFIGASLIMVINVLAVEQFGFGKAMASYMVAAELVGVAVGGVIGGRLGKNPRWYKALPWIAIAMGLVMCLVGFVAFLPQNAVTSVMFALLALIGIAGGMFMIPCEAFVQIRPEPGRKGAVIAAANFAVFSGILLSGFVGAFLTEYLLATDCFVALGAMTLMLGDWLLGRFDSLAGSEG